MRRILIFGNSGSGKSTLAKKLCHEEGLVHLDLDSLAWLSFMPLQRRPIADSGREIAEFIETTPGWIIEGCYADLLALAMPFANELVYLDLPVEACVDNARARPWEPHKYPDKAAQDANLPMLIDWIRQYPVRDDTFSPRAHLDLYERFEGHRLRIQSRSQLPD